MRIKWPFLWKDKIGERERGKEISFACYHCIFLSVLHPSCCSRRLSIAFDFVCNGAKLMFLRKLICEKNPNPKVFTREILIFTHSQIRTCKIVNNEILTSDVDESKNVYFSNSKSIDLPFTNKYISCNFIFSSLIFDVFRDISVLFSNICLSFTITDEHIHYFELYIYYTLWAFQTVFFSE